MFCTECLPSLYIRQYVEYLHLFISPSFSFSFNNVTIASLASLVAHSPGPDMLHYSCTTAMDMGL